MNTTLGKIGNSNNAPLVLALLASKCTPILTYSLEAICLQKSALDNICYISNAIYSKLFKTFDKSVIEQCRWNFGYLPLSMDLNLKRINFLNNLSNGYSFVCSPAIVLFHLVAKEDLSFLCDKYQITLNGLRSFVSRKKAVWTAFHDAVK